MPNTIEQNLQRLVDAKSAISEAITAKGGTVSTGDGFEDFPTDIASIPSGGGGGSGDASKPVKFIDYDGSIVASYTPEEFAELTEMPANPSHDGLTAQGWNWTLSDAKEYVSSYGTLNVGQMYITDDGRTRLYVRMQEGRLSPVLKLYLNDNSSLDIDWGDDTSHSTFTSSSADYKSERHTYASAGDYIISIGVTSGSFSLQSSSTETSTLLTNGNESKESPNRGYLNTIHKIEIGDGATSINASAFYCCMFLSHVTIPSGVTGIGDKAFDACFSLSQVTLPNSVTNIGSYAFMECFSLSHVTIPDSVTSISAYAFSKCYSLSQVTLPNDVTFIGYYTFSECSSLSQATIPDSVTSIVAYAFSGCTSLSQVTIPDGVTSIGDRVFQSCRSLHQVTIPDSVTSIGNGVFVNCNCLPQVTIPDSVTSIGETIFFGCMSLSQVTIPDSVTSIGASLFEYCYSLSQVTIPDGVTSIKNEAFGYCYSLSSIKFTQYYPPSVSNSNAFYSLPTDCKILVPRGRLSAYRSATNYPSPSTYSYMEYDV